jgi:hypothetical protein
VDTAPKTAVEQVTAWKAKWRQQIEADVKAEFGQHVTRLNALVGAAREAAEEKAEAIVRKRPGRSVHALVNEAGSIVDCLDNLTSDSPLVQPLAARLFEIDELVLRTSSANGRDLADKVDLLLSQLDPSGVGQFVMELAESIRDDAISLPEPIPDGCTPAAGVESF